MMKAVVFNLGCKVNQYECDTLAAGLKQMGYETFEELTEADVYVINTCAVTAEAERKSRQALTRIRKLNPNAYVAVCGCASQKNPKFYVDNGVEYVLGVGGKERILERLGSRNDKVQELPTEYEDTKFLPTVARTRIYVKIQDGCNNFCSYCIIPYLRGRSRSRSIAKAAEEIRALASKTEEIVITGVNLAQYGKDNNESLAGLIRELKDVDVRIRLGSFYVEGIDNELLDALFALKKFCPQFHLSLQNGDDGVLKSMNRHYTVEQYKQKVALIRSYDKNAAITTDIIVGFPTETDEAFENTLRFVKEVGFSYIHIFPYSSREGTVAAGLKVLPPETVKERRKKLEAARESLVKDYLTSLMNVPQTVVFEEKHGEYQEGYSQYYVRCYADTDKKVATLMPEAIYKDGFKLK